MPIVKRFRCRLSPRRKKSERKTRRPHDSLPYGDYAPLGGTARRLKFCTVARALQGSKFLKSSVRGLFVETGETAWGLAPAVGDLAMRRPSATSQTRWLLIQSPVF